MTQTSPALSYDIVMATRNRPDVVELSLPLLLAQSRPPERIIIVDSSDDETPIRRLAEHADAGSDVPVEYMRAPAGLTLQRNIGIRAARADVIIFPDDDSLFYEDTAAQIMAIYDADIDGVITGVAGRGVDRAPLNISGDLNAYEAEKTSALRSALKGTRQQLKEIFGFANPFVATGRVLNRKYPRPSWLGARYADVVPYMTGYRMSFRREALAKFGFDETLKKYGWFEDIDASYGAMREGLVVMANKARVYHHRVAGARGNGHRIGQWAILNRGYVVMKHVHAHPEKFPHPRREARRLHIYCRLRGLAYTLIGVSEFGRDRARGARGALPMLRTLTSAPANELTQIYCHMDRQ
ncbi:MAG: glycosyltransferase [Mangrovicoccus sp.]|nr:glycosyltransferase [Mangrovicoccus sp.]